MTSAGTPPIALEPPVEGTDHRLVTDGIACALREAGDGTPLLLVHSVNAAASSYETKPVFDAMARTRRVFALDLPGFGRSERGRAAYTVALYTEAVAAAARLIRDRTGRAPAALGLSLSCEFLARAEVEQPGLFRSLTFVTPTGFEAGSERRRRAPGRTLGLPGLERFLTLPLVRQGLFGLLVSRSSVRFFLRRTFGGAEPPADLVDYAYRSAHQPGASFAAFAFASGKLFSADIRDVYEALTLPVWLAHGTKGPFSNFGGADWVVQRRNWAVTPFETGAFPHFEAPSQFLPLLSRFLDAAASPDPVWEGALALAPLDDPGTCL